MTSLTPQLFVRSLVITFALLSGSQAFAASACKGQVDTACDQNDSCYWVTGYQRSNGAKVKGHCRSRPQSSIKDAASKNQDQIQATITTVSTKTESNTTSSTE